MSVAIKRRLKSWVCTKSRQIYFLKPDLVFGIRCSKSRECSKSKNAKSMDYCILIWQIWRRSFDVPPPAMEADHPYYENIVKDERYQNEPKPEEFPMFESLKLTIAR